MMKPKVWIVGFPRCGTASLCEALRILGWNPIHNPRHWDQLDGHDAAGDVLIAAHWRELEEMFPGSLFILSTRNFRDWTKSLQRIPGFWVSDLSYDRYYRARLYLGATLGDRRALRIVWDRHHDKIRSTIPHQRLLTFSLPFDWTPLCAFLGVPEPSVSFPWLNRRSNQDVKVRYQAHESTATVRPGVTYQFPIVPE